MSYQPDFEQGVEWAALEWLCLGLDASEAIPEFLNLLRHPDCNSDVLLGHAVRHNLAATVGHALNRPTARGLVHKRIRSHCREFFNLTRERNTMLTCEAGRVAAALESRALTVAVTKGVVVQFIAYDGVGTRQFSDVDLMILPEQSQEAAAELVKLGYAFAGYDSYTDCLQPLPRAEQLMYTLSPDHLPQALAVRDQRAVRVVAIDCAYSFTWAHAPWQVNMELALSSITRVPCNGPGDSLPTLHLGYSWLFVVLHLFREAWITRTVNEQFTTLAQFRDVTVLWRRFGGSIRDMVVEALRADNLWFPVAWVCSHVDRTLGTRISDDLGLTNILPEGALNTALASDGELLQWQGTMRERLRRARPLELTPIDDDSLRSAAGLSPRQGNQA